MYAIVDIETTGGYATQNCITEIAIILHNGCEVEGKYQTLINPERPIQKYVQGMTGITDAMVAVAPKFEEVAANIHNLLIDRIFVAHNVNFDYSFIKQHLKTAGYDIDLPKICTIKMARRIFPGLPKYGLASLCHHFTIKNDARHRAYGDALATTELLMLLLANDKSGELTKLAKKRKQSQYLPPNLKTDIADKIPSLPGVYYFHNNKGKIIYVGKAVNLKKRINSHFSNNKATKQKQDFLREIFEITWKDCSSDLTASIFESIEIRRLWPKFNKSQKHYERQYGIFMFEDNLGHQRLAIDTTKKIIEPLATFQLLVDARQMLFMLCEKFDIEHYMFFLSKETPLVKPPKDEHNEKVAEIIIYLKQSKQNFLLHDGAKHYLLVNNGKFCAMGKIEILTKNPKLEKVRTHLTAYSNNTTIESYIKKYVLKSPESVIAI